MKRIDKVTTTAKEIAEALKDSARSEVVLAVKMTDDELSETINDLVRKVADMKEKYRKAAAYFLTAFAELKTREDELKVFQKEENRRFELFNEDDD